MNNGTILKGHINYLHTLILENIFLEEDREPITCLEHGDKNITEMNEEKKVNFSMEQALGAFLSDYMGFWILPIDSALCINEKSKIYSTVYKPNY